MKKFVLRLSSNQLHHTRVEMNGILVCPIVEKTGRSTYTYETEDSDVEVKIFTESNELLVEHWFLRFLYYYMISLLGIFDWDYSSNGYGFCYTAVYHVDADTTIDLKWNHAKEGESALVPKSEESAFMDNDTNVYTYDKRVKRRFRGTLAFKILSWIAIIVTIVLTTIF